METLASILTLVQPHCFMAKVDIKDVYYSVPIHEGDQKLLKFHFENVLYKFTALSNGHTTRPRKFTKLLKPPLATIRQIGVTLASYIDDIFTCNKSYDICQASVEKLVFLLQKFRFYSSL